ncbi:DUF3267 domain-containing protein [Psychrobacillus sp. FSL H8-0483]|uniref:DUF3267 domain-containing protein n=1 Tax=Psychrobacillus sp. FSL H8-0483 TaxID=2921389 RepID=UPI00315ABEB8
MKKQYGLERLFLLSSILVITVFSFAYALLGIINDSHKSDEYFLIFILAFLSVYPIHKLFHFIPLFRYREKIKFEIKKQFKFFPIFSLRVFEPINKNRFLFSLLSPFIFINPTLIIGALVIPNFAHYFTMLFAYHCGICFIDLIYVKNLSRSPKKALIEETDAGYEILIASTHP